MTAAFDLRVETAGRLNPHGELALLREALARNPDNPTIRYRVAALLNQTDQFDDVIALLDPAQDRSFEESIVLMFAWLSLESQAGNAAVIAMAPALAGAAEDDRQRAAILAELGKAQARAGLAEAEATLKRALVLDPHNNNACKRLAALYLRADNHTAVLDFTGDLLAAGAAHSRLFAARVMALAIDGKPDEARALEGRDQFGKRAMLPVPPGFATLAEFNGALAGQLLGHPELRYERYGTASEATWRIDNPQHSAAPLVDVLLTSLRGEIAAHIGSLASAAHPWLDARPDAATLHCWSVITDDVGYETWHVHQFGWLSGTYYVQVPETIASGNGLGGCLAHGLPEDLVGDDTAMRFGRDFLRPQAGLYSLFPSHCYHRTFAHSLPERRICVAFDIWPH